MINCAIKQGERKRKKAGAIIFLLKNHLQGTVFRIFDKIKRAFYNEVGKREADNRINQISDKHYKFI